MEPAYYSPNDHGERILSREEMEALAADYAFGALDTDELAQDRSTFERSLPAYPDLMQDVADMKAAFIIQSEIHSQAQSQPQHSLQNSLHHLREQRSQQAAGRLRNLSLHVQSQIAERRKRSERWKFGWRLLAPSLAACALIAVIVAPPTTLTGLFAPAPSLSEQALLRPDEESMIREGNNRAGGILESDVPFAVTNADSTASDIDDKESLTAVRMLNGETLAALSADESPFTDRFAGESAFLQTIGDEEVSDADVTALLSNM